MRNCQSLVIVWGIQIRPTENNMCVRKLFNLVTVLEEVNVFLVGLTCGLFWFCCVGRMTMVLYTLYVGV